MRPIIFIILPSDKRCLLGTPCFSTLPTRARPVHARIARRRATALLARYCAPCVRALRYIRAARSRAVVYRYDGTPRVPGVRCEVYSPEPYARHAGTALRVRAWPAAPSVVHPQAAPPVASPGFTHRRVLNESCWWADITLFPRRAFIIHARRCTNRRRNGDRGCACQVLLQVRGGFPPCSSGTR